MKYLKIEDNRGFFLKETEAKNIEWKPVDEITKEDLLYLLNKAIGELPLKGGLDQNIIAAFERIAQGLKTLSWNAAKASKLNPTQIQLLTFLLKHEPTDYYVSDLAKEFNISNSSISDTISALVKKGLVNKVREGADNRHIKLELTSAGRSQALNADNYAGALISAINQIDIRDKEKLVSLMGDIILALHDAKIFPVQRMCLTCHFHMTNADGHFCKLLEKHLNIGDLRLDCAEHLPITI
ncbi:MAG: MarR family winged helix-turn-helix transcriptional regulator [Mucilaginibacter sp.]|uniref:MarR family winged helix-turn-helix transcriptional regulator n=1 Tax=Mucilaginibacter sp. TaxID=1882438 RepID=UPI0031B3E440